MNLFNVGTDGARTLLHLSHILSGLRTTTSLVRLGRALQKYDPNQPRIPAGSAEGGRWTSAGGGSVGGSRDGQEPRTPTEAQTPAILVEHLDPLIRIERDTSGQQPWRELATTYRPDGSVESRTVLNRDGSIIRSTYGRSDAGDPLERHVVTTAEGHTFAFETEGDRQRIRTEDGTVIADTVLGPKGPEPRAVVDQAGQSSVWRSTVGEAARILYGTPVGSPFINQPVLLALRARQYQPSGAGENDVVLVRGLGENQLETVCPAYRELQAMARQTAAGVLRDGLTPTQYGTRIHYLMDIQVKEAGNPKIKSEQSFLKYREESLINRETPYGYPGSIRIDIYERIREDTICIYDLKTGARGLSLARSIEIAETVRRKYGALSNIYIIELRP